MAGIKRSLMEVRQMKGQLTAGAPIVVLSVSGGKDSVAMWLLLWQEGVKNLCPVRFDGGWEYELVPGEIKKLEKITGIECWTLDHSERFDQDLIARGWPRWSVRWCTGYKRDVLRKFYNSIRRGNPDYDVISAVGIAADEKDRKSRGGVSAKSTWLPLVDFGITGAGAMRLCHRYGIDWGGHYAIKDRLSCWCCPWQTKDSLMDMYFHDKERWARLKAMDSTAPEGRKFLWGRKSIEQLETEFEEYYKRGMFRVMGKARKE